MKNNKMYLTTGEFARLCHTTKHTLFHYCDINLFSPVYTDENGYRYYHVLQYDTFLTITQLRTIGMSLSEIKRYMTERTPQRMVELYNQQEQSISKQISELKQIKERISTQKKNILHVLTCSEEYFLEKQRKCWLFCSDTVLPTDEYMMTSVIGNLIYSVNGKISSNTMGMICKLNDAVHLENYPFRFYVYTNFLKRENCRIKPEGIYLSTYHRGEYETLGLSYRNLVFYAKEHHIEMDDWIYAETIIGDWAVCQPQDYIVKVSVKVKEDTVSKVKEQGL